MAKELKKVFLSVPMTGKTEVEIEGELILTRRMFLKKAKELGRMKTEAYEFVDNFHNPKIKDIPSEVINEDIYRLAKALELMSTCNYQAFYDGWERSFGCGIEMQVAIANGLVK